MQSISSAASNTKPLTTVRVQSPPLAASGSPIGGYDVLIAGQARSRDLTLITRNVGEFSRVPGLRIENWET